MNCFEKSEKLEENLNKRFGLDEDAGDYIHVSIIGVEIKARKVLDWKETERSTTSIYSPSWTLDDWKAFRDRCLLELR